MSDSNNEGAEHENEDGEEVQPSMDFLREMFSQLNFLNMNHSLANSNDEEDRPKQVLEDLNFDGVLKYMNSEQCNNIVVMCGAGVSTAAGIPDFRTPGTGLYDNLQKYDLPEPHAIFELDFFKENPKPFFSLAKELYPGKFKPTYSHYFILMLERKGLLRRVYTQNIDTLERVAGISGDKIVEAHGAFHTAHCVECSKQHTQEFVREKIFSDEIPVCDLCPGVVKPDIVFFGEGLPERFFSLREADFAQCDLLLVMGTSLKVQPFANLTGCASKETPRVLINRDKCGQDFTSFSFYGSSSLDFDSPKAYRDVALLGDCDAQCRRIAEAMGWAAELDEIVKKEHARIDGEQKEEEEEEKENKVEKSEEASGTEELKRKEEGTVDGKSNVGKFQSACA